MKSPTLKCKTKPQTFKCQKKKKVQTPKWQNETTTFKCKILKPQDSFLHFPFIAFVFVLGVGRQRVGEGKGKVVLFKEKFNSLLTLIVNLKLNKLSYKKWERDGGKAWCPWNELVEMRILRWKWGNTRKFWIRNECIIGKAEVSP